MLQADLNFISQHDLDAIAARLQNPSSKQIIGQVMPIDANATRFSLRYRRHGRDTAAVRGILQRWAGEMTHIYCEGRAFQRRHYLRGGFRLLYRAILLLPLLLILQLALVLFWGSAVPAFLFLSLVATLAALVFAGMVFGLRECIRLLTAAPEQDPLLDFKPQPEAKDRELLLDYLAEVIRDGAIHENDEATGDTISREAEAAGDAVYYEVMSKRAAP